MKATALLESGKCNLCRKERQVLKVSIDGKPEVLLCQRCHWAMAEMQLPIEKKEVKHE